MIQICLGQYLDHIESRSSSSHGNEDNVDTTRWEQVHVVGKRSQPYELKYHKNRVMTSIANRRHILLCLQFKVS